MTGASAAVGGETPTDTWQRISTPASTIGPWLPEGDLGGRLAEGLGRVEEALLTAVGSEHAFVREAAGDLLADLGPEAVRIQARTFERLVTGQIRETVGAQPGDDPVAHYLEVLADKTGSLVATSARFGASFAGVDADLVAALTAFGEEVGVAFQLSDDLLDIVSRDGASGKSPGTDLREGIATLPALFALAGDDPAERRLRELVSGPITDHAEHAEALALLRSSAALHRATEVLRECADRAQTRLAGVPEGPVRQALSALCDYVVSRTS